MKKEFTSLKRMMNSSIIIMMQIGCATRSETSSPPSSISSGEGGIPQHIEVTACEEGKKRACHVSLQAHNGVTNCFVGVQYCVAGIWSDCGVGQ